MLIRCQLWQGTNWHLISTLTDKQCLLCQIKWLGGLCLMAEMLGAYLRAASAWRPSGGRGCLWGPLPLIQKHFQEPSDCFLVLSFLQMLPLGIEMVLLMEPGFTCLTCRSSSHFLSFLLSLLAPVRVQFFYSHAYLNAKPGSTSSKLWALNKCSWLLWTSFSFSLPQGRCLSIKTIGRMSARFLAQRRSSIHFSSFFLSPLSLLVSKSWAMALLHSAALWPDCHHSQCSVLAETQVDSRQRNTQWLGLNAGSTAR